MRIPYVREMWNVIGIRAPAECIYPVYFFAKQLSHASNVKMPNVGTCNYFTWSCSPINSSVIWIWAYFLVYCNHTVEILPRFQLHLLVIFFSFMTNIDFHSTTATVIIWRLRLFHWLIETPTCILPYQLSIAKATTQANPRFHQMPITNLSANFDESQSSFIIYKCYLFDCLFHHYTCHQTIFFLFDLPFRYFYCCAVANATILLSN